MITIVYSTKKSDWKKGQYLRQSCGISNAEVIEIENPGIMSLTQAYQKGLTEAKNDIIVFVHDDVHFQTEKWGSKIKKMFDTTDFGIIGLAGTTDLGDDGKWWEQRTRMVGIVKHTNGQKTWENKYSGSFPKHIIQTVNTDGLFIAVNRQKIKYEFDTTIPGFHFYDIDFTFGNHIKGVKVGVTTDIHVVHRGLGETDQQWEENRKTFIAKFKEYLPASIVPDPIIKPITEKFNETPKVAIVIHGKDANKISDCVNNLCEKTEYSNYRIIVCYSDYDDVKINNDKIDTIVEATIDSYAANSNKIVKENLKPDEEIVVFMTENSFIENDVISLGVKNISRNKNCGTITARIYNSDKSIFNNGYEIWNIMQPPVKEGDQPQSNLLVNLVGNGSYYSFRNECVFDTIGGTKDFFMCKVDLYKKIKFNENYKKAFQDLEFNLRAINDHKVNIVLGNGVVQLKETVNPDPEYYEDLNKVFLPYLYSQELSSIDKHIKNYIVPQKHEQ